MADVSLSINADEPRASARNGGKSSRGGSTGPFGLAVEVLLVFVFTTMLLMTYMARIQFDDYLQEAALKLRGETLEKMRREKLVRLQKTIFVNPKRPPDHTYNMLVNCSLASACSEVMTFVRRDPIVELWHII